MVFCKSWAASGACGTSTTAATSAMSFLGKKVIVNPKADEATTTTYNVSIPDTLFKYYDGLSANAALAWEYSFTVHASTTVDTGKPELFGLYVDCSGDGGLTVNEGTDNDPLLSDTCDGNSDGTADFAELTSSLAAAGTTGVGTDTQFKLYFKENVQVSTPLFKLTGDDGSSADMVATSTTVGATDSTVNVVTADPSLKSGVKYTITIGSGTIKDIATLKNPYAGTSFMFYTPLLLSTANSLYPAHGSTLVSAETWIRMRFQNTPRLAKGATVTISDGTATESISLDDSTYVKKQDFLTATTPESHRC